jgi:hypothetical protein
VPLILVILLQKPKPTVDKTLAGPYNLVVGLQCIEDGNCSANGVLYRDSEDPQIGITFTANETTLVINGLCPNCTLQNVSVYGLRASMTNCAIVTADIGANCTVKEEKGVIEINDLELDISDSKNYTIEWGFGTEEPEAAEQLDE